ncbi:MAG TPA: hypothetical protein VGA33_05800 [Thermoanaerobaculia bacterium]
MINRAALTSQIAPCLLQNHAQTIAEADQKKNVDRQSREPLCKSADVKAAEVRDRCAHPMVASEPLSQ